MHKCNLDEIKYLMSLQLYNGYVEAQDQLLLARQENKRVNKYLDEIVKEVEMKAPLLKRQREEYERVQKAVANLSAKLEDAMKVVFVLNLLASYLLWKYVSAYIMHISYVYRKTLFLTQK